MFILYFILSFCSSLSYAQDLGEKQNGIFFKDGINFEHDPANFKTKFRFRMQNRFTYATEDDEDLSAKTVDLNVRRLRLRMDGTVWDPRFLYKIQLAFTRGDMDYDRTQYPNILRDAVVGWKLTDATTLWYGQTKLPGNRQRLVSSGAQQFVDRSIVNATFNIDRDLGTQLHHTVGEARPVNVKLAISNGEGRSSDNKDSGLAYTARLEWLALGPFKKEGDFFESDLAREDSPKLALGGAYNLNKKTTRPGGQLGTQFTTPGLSRDLETYFADLLFKFQGISFYGEYARRWAHDPVFTDGAKSVSIFKGEGLNFQTGYVFENNIEPALRYSRTRAIEEVLAGGMNDQDQYTFALSKYINEHKVKVQGDLSYDEFRNRVAGNATRGWTLRLQFELGI
jgi:phosphate-selective porin OprO/OprP